MLAAVGGDLLDLERDVAADVDEERGLAACAARPSRSKSANDMQRSSRLQSTNWTSAPARIAASGVAMNVFDGHSTVSPWTPAKCSAASAPPAQLETATAGTSFQASQAARSGRHHVALGPAVGVEHLVDQRVQARAIAMVEPDREPREVRRARCEAETVVMVICVVRSGRRDRALLRRPQRDDPRAGWPILSQSVCALASLSDRQDGTEFARLSSSQDQLPSAAAVRRCEPRDAVEVGVVQEDHVAGQQSARWPGARSAPAW